MNWTCTATAGSACTASGSGALADTASLLPSGHLTYVITVHIGAAATGVLSNTATATVPASVTETSSADNTATDVDTLVAVTDLSITKTDNVTTAVPGTTVTYTIVATNNGPSAAVGASISDTFPATLGAVAWTCVGPCTPVGSGSLSDVVNLPVGGSVTYTVTATVAANATGALVNTATVSRRSRHHRSEPSRQHGDRHRHPDSSIRSVDHQDRRRDIGDPGHTCDVHGDGRQQWSVERGRRLGGRLVRRQPVERDVDVRRCQWVLCHGWRGQHQHHGQPGHRWNRDLHGDRRHRRNGNRHAVEHGHASQLRRRPRI